MRRFVLLLFALVLFPVAPVAAQAGSCPPPPDGWGTYTIQSSDILYRIAQRFRTSVDDLVRVNCIANRDIIFAGQVLRVLPDHMQQDDTAPFVGTYLMNRAGSSGEQHLTLQLEPNFQALLTIYDSATNATMLEAGTWAHADSIITVTLTETLGEFGYMFNQPVTMVLQLESGFLTAVSYDIDQFGAQGVQFTVGSGDYNPAVRAIQDKLASITFVGYSIPESENGFYGETTRQAVVRFQESQGMSTTGVVDKTTWDALQRPNEPIVPTPIPTPEGHRADPARFGVPDLTTLPSHDENDSPIAYFTFDDGPDHTNTPKMLEVLETYGAKATFFVLGQNARALPQLIRDEASRGHYVASHTWDHRSLLGMDHNAFLREVQRTTETLIEIAGDLFGLDGTVRYLRPPYGATDYNTRQWAASLGYAVVLWNIDPQDWRRPGVDQIVANVMAHIGPGRVVLMHDGGGDRSQSIAALNIILPRLKEQGYVFHTIFGT